LNLISDKAKSEKNCKFSNLAHLLNETNLTDCFYRLAPISHQYDINLPSNMV
jgi:hypothetical protein